MGTSVHCADELTDNKSTNKETGNNKSNPPISKQKQDGRFQLGILWSDQLRPHSTLQGGSPSTNPHRCSMVSVDECCEVHAGDRAPLSGDGHWRGLPGGCHPRRTVDRR